MAKASFCPKCGSKLGEGDLFCIECGCKLEPRKEEEPVIYPEEEQTPVQLVQEEDEETVLRSGGAWYMRSTFSVPRGTLKLTNNRITFIAEHMKREMDVEIPLADVELTKIVSKGLAYQIFGVYLKDKQYNFQVSRYGTEWVEQINNAVKAAKSGKISAAPKQKTGYIQELKQLKELVDMGIITEAEFNAKKKNLLGL